MITSILCPEVSIKDTRSLYLILVVASFVSGWQLIDSYLVNFSSSINLTCFCLSLMSPNTVTDPGITPSSSSNFSGAPNDILPLAPIV